MNTAERPPQVVEQSTDDLVESTKRWFESKTIWFNLVLVVMALTSVQNGSLQTWLELLPAEDKAWVMAAVPLVSSLINLWLRKVTKQPLQ